jgi:hypothetical protein
MKLYFISTCLRVCRDSRGQQSRNNHVLLSLSSFMHACNRKFTDCIINIIILLNLLLYLLLLLLCFMLISAGYYY